jgi:signal transduction histidine kinase
MKVFSQGIWPRRKIIIIFLFGLIIPSLCVGYLSWNAFSQRREALKKVIESQLWISGETALKSIEEALLEYEKRLLDPENFTPLLDSSENHQEFKNPSSFSKEIFFLLAEDFRIVFPQTGSENIPFAHWEQSLPDSPFSSLFQRAQFLEYNRKDLAQAADLYRQSCLVTPVKQLQAFALERYARCLVALKKNEEASQVYWNLLDEFSQYKNRAGHPYGVLAVLNLYYLSVPSQGERDPLRALLEVLGRLRTGEWQLNNSSYEYFSKEIERIVKKEISDETFPELSDYYTTILEKPSPYIKELEFKKILEESVIPKLKERITFSQYSNESQSGHFPVDSGDSNTLISYSRLGDISTDQFFYAGFCWDLDYIKNQKMPEIARTLEQASGIRVRLIDDSFQNEAEEDNDVIPKDSLSITFRHYPFPWRLIVTQTALENLKGSAFKENIISGILLAFVVALMCLGTVMILRDISRESATTRHKTEFVHNVSHELKTPLTLIRLYGETLKDQKDLPEENRKEAYEIITRESERLSYMINNVLDFSRIETGKKEFNLKSGCLDEAIRETLDLYRPHLEKKGFTVHVKIENSLPPLDFDREAVASVVVNLLSNCMKFSADKKEVFVRLFRKDNDAVLQVEDKGIGISPKEIHKIFQRFYRSQNSIFSGSAGSGLGLTIVKHIAEAHGGKIEVESEEGKGSVFSVVLPFSKFKEDKK